MPYSIEWYIEGQVLYGAIWGVQTLDELKQSNALMVGYLDSSDGRLIHMIMSDQNLEKLPVSLAQTQNILTYTKHPNLGWAIMVGDKEKGLKGAAEDFLITFLAKLARARFIRFKTVDEALQHLREVDATINWDAVVPEANDRLNELAQPDGQP